MDNKSKIDHKSGGDSQSHGEGRSKEAALDKLRKMEWMRNKQDPWHLSRSNSKGFEIQEKKKYNKDDDNYFDGTNSQKSKKGRKPRPEAGTQSLVVPPGFSVGASSCGPPPVNAWAQKKGSALFNKPQEVVDEEDEDIRLAMELSLKSQLEDDQRRSVMFGLMQPKPTKCQVPAENEWKNWNGSEYSAGPETEHTTSNLHFIDTDSTEEPPTYNQRRKLPPPKTRKTPSPPKNVYTTQPEDKNTVVEPPKMSKKLSSAPVNNTGYNTLDQLQTFEGCSVSPVSNNIDKENPIASQAITYGKPTPNPKYSRAIVIPEINESTVSSDSNLSASTKPTLSFGDTQDVFEKIQNDYTYKSSTVSESHQYEALPLDNRINSSVEMPILNSPSSSDLAAVASSSEETDKIIHSFLRHEPPPQILNTVLPHSTNSLTDGYPLNNSEQYVAPGSLHFDQHQSHLNGFSFINPQPTLINNSSQDSSSSMSDSPLQNVSPYGSIENQISSGVAGNMLMPSQNAQISYPLSVNVPGKQEISNQFQAMQLANCNVPSQMIYPTVPPGYVTHNQPLQAMVPMNPQLGQIPGHPQFYLPNSNMMTPALPGQDLNNSSPQLYHLQQLMAMNALQHYHQSQFPVSDAAELLRQEQTNGVISQPQTIPVLQNQTQLTQAQNQQQFVHGTNHPQMISTQHQPQVIQQKNQSQINQIQEKDMPTNEYQNQMNYHNQPDQGLPANSKDSEELILQMKQMLQSMNQLHQEMISKYNVAQIQSPPIPIPQTRPYVYPPHPMAMGTNNMYAGMSVIPQFQQQHVNQEVMGSDQLSPNSQQGNPSPGQQNMDPEMSIAQAPIERKIGRGRGRFY